MASFGDLNIPASSNRVELSQRIHHAKNLGYNFIAVNRVVTGNLQPNEHKCTFKPLDIENDNGNDGLLVLGKKSFKQYSRLTVVLDSPNQMHSLNPGSPVIKSYDIFAVQPTNEKLFQQACSSPLEVDIIVLAQSSRQPFPLRVPTIKMALERGIYFEICYSHCLDNSSSNRFLMSNALNLIRVTKGKNILISSSARGTHELRSPYDVAALAHLFGLDYQTAQDSISINANRVLQHSMARNTHKSVVGGVNMNSLTERDKSWLIEDDTLTGKKRTRDGKLITPSK